MRRRHVIALLLCAVTVAVYAQVSSHGFVDFDDPDYVLANPHVLGGLSAHGVAWAFSTGHAGNWHPLTWLSHMLDVELYGREPGGHHVTSLVLHVLNTLLLFAVLIRWTGAEWRSAFVAGAFALHPLHVESVAWLAERKDVLSTTFWMLALLAYTRYAREPRPSRYGLVVLMLVLGLMCKPMLVSLPVVLLLLDFWPLARTQERSWPRLVREKIPLFAAAAASSVVTLVMQQRAGAVSSLETFSIPVRIGNAIRACMAYLLDTLWPSGLSCFYPYQPGSALAPITLLALLFLVAATVAAVRYRGRYPYVTTGWLWYLVTLLPVIGLIQVGMQSRADRYTYVPLIGVFLLIAWLVPEVAARLRLARAVVPALALLALLALAWLCHAQVGVWKNSITLYSQALDVDPHNWLAHGNLGSVLYQQGNVDDAERHDREALRIHPEFAQAHNNYAVLLASDRGQLDEALVHHREAIRLRNEATFVDNLVRTLNRKARLALSGGKLAEARDCYVEILQNRPASAEAHANLGLVLSQLGEPAAAEEHLVQAVRLKPDSAEARNNLGAFWVRTGRFDQALAVLTEAVRLKPEFAEARHNLGLVLTAQGKLDQAITELHEALRLEPSYADAHHNLGVALEARNEIAAAVDEYRAALQLSPQNERYKASLDKALAKMPAGR
jgi:tetratricopeptide (TPR) repeat protein